MLLCDSLKNNKTTGGSKHIDIKYLVVKEKIQNGVVSIEHIENTLMLANPLTKGYPLKLFKNYVTRMSVWQVCQILINWECNVCDHIIIKIKVFYYDILMINILLLLYINFVHNLDV